jgi:hypothetical protein
LRRISVWPAGRVFAGRARHKDPETRIRIWSGASFEVTIADGTNGPYLPCSRSKRAVQGSRINLWTPSTFRFSSPDLLPVNPPK